MTRTFHEVVVTRRQTLSPGMLRLTFAAEGLAALGSARAADEYLRLFFPDPLTGIRVLPEIDAQGRWTYPEGPSKVRTATYTVRRLDAQGGELDIDFVIHEGGLACDWAQSAEPGDSVVVTAPQGVYARPPDARWQILVADATGLPAVARILEETPEQVASRVILEVADPGHELPLIHPALTDVTWLHGGNGLGPSRLEAALRAMPMPLAPGYIWAAGEQKSVRGIRKYVRHDLGLPRDRYALVSYWVAEAERWNAGWQALDQDIRSRIEAAWWSGRDLEDVRDEVDATLEALGL